MVVDFDGTLSPIVDDPARARAAPGAAEALVALAARFGLVAVMSGRPTDFLRTVVPAEVVLSGLYGLEVVRDGRADRPPGCRARGGRSSPTSPARRPTRARPAWTSSPRACRSRCTTGAIPTLAEAVVAWARRSGGPLGPRGAAGQDVGRAAPADRGRQGHGPRGAGRRLRRRLLRRRRPGRPAGVRRARPHGRPGRALGAGRGGQRRGPVRAAGAGRPRARRTGGGRGRSSAAWPGRPTAAERREGRAVSRPRRAGRPASRRGCGRSTARAAGRRGRPARRRA